MSDEGLLAGRHGGRARARQKKAAVLVLGMHRSGTSALTRVLNLLGCALPKTLMGAAKGNEAGHWESTVICQLNDRILKSAGSQWNDWQAVNPGWAASPSAQEYHDEALAVLDSEFGTSRLFVVKDPRICRMPGFWIDALEAFDAEPRIVLPLRNPLEVAASLAARDGIDPSIGHLLWLRHVLDAEAATRGRPRVFLRYDDLLTQWRGPVDRMQAALGLSLPRLSETAALEVESFLSERLHHERAAPAALSENSGLSQWLRDSFAILDGWARHGETAADAKRLDGIRAAFDAAAPAFARPIVAGEKAAAARRKAEHDLAGARGQLAERDEKLAGLERERAAITRDLADLRGRLAQAESALAQRRHEAEQSAGELAAAQQELRALKAARAEYETLLAAYREQLALLTAHERERQAALAALEEKSRREIEAKDAALAALRREADGARAALHAAHEERAAAGREQQAALAALEETSRQQAREKDAALAALRQEADGARQALDAAQKARAQLEQEKKQAAAEAQKAKAEKQAVEGRLKERFDEIAVLTRMVSGQEAASEHIRRSMAALVSLDGTPPLVPEALWRPLALRRKVALLKRSGLFDAEWYLKANDDVRKAGVDPFEHYAMYGAAEGRAPNEAFGQLRGARK